MPGPARITIELEPSGRDGWVTRTHVDDGASAARGRQSRQASRSGNRGRRAGDAPAVASASFIAPTEPREPAVVPTAYEPASECTCPEGWCDLDHAND
jgi:hypothetical protein